MISESVIDAFGGDAKLAADVVAELTKGHNFNLVQAQDRQNKVARLNQVEHGATPLGEMRMRIDADAYHYWGQRLGYDCWKDPQFLDEYARDNPAVKVKYKRMPMVQIDGFKKQVNGQSPIVNGVKAASSNDAQARSNATPPLAPIVHCPMTNDQPAPIVHCPLSNDQRTYTVKDSRSAPLTKEELK